MQTTSLRDARRIMHESIDASITAAPTIFSLGYKIDREGELMPLTDAQPAPIEKITFTAPGVGKYTVMNTRERLTEFRAEIAKNTGFNAAYRGKPQASQRFAPAVESVKSMLATLGEIVSGYELATLRGLKIELKAIKQSDGYTSIIPLIDGKTIKGAFSAFHPSHDISDDEAAAIWLDSMKQLDGINEETDESETPEAITPEAIAAPQPTPAPASDGDELAKLKAEFEELLAENKKLIDELDAYKSRDSESGRADAIEHGKAAVSVARNTAATWFESMSTIARLTRAYRGKNSADIREALNVASATICTINQEIDAVRVAIEQ